jgi:hypothetical protein
VQRTSARSGATGRDNKAGIQEATLRDGVMPGAPLSMSCRQQPQPANSIDRRFWFEFGSASPRLTALCFGVFNILGIAGRRV